MENWKAIRQDVLVHGLSQRAALQQYHLGWHTLKKILAHAEPPGYRQRQQVFLPLVHPPGEAQVDFGEATITLAGQPTKVARFLPAHRCAELRRNGMLRDQR